MPRREKGALLGIVMVLLVLVLAASGFAFWGLRGETSSAGNDRLARQLFDCAEYALALGKQKFGAERAGWDTYLNTDVCSTLPCPPFPNGASGNPALNYPAGTPFTGQYSVTTTNGTALTFNYNMGIYNNHENLKTSTCNSSGADPSCQYHDGDNTVVLYAKCTDPTTHQSRSTQVVLYSEVKSQGCPYRSMAGAGCRGDGNQN